jgi:hypothetical protein
MDVCLFFLATIIAYCKGARGVWLLAIVLFSWPAFMLWLVTRNARPKREDAELKRTLMIVRAINPAMADEIEVDEAIERTLAAGRRPKRPPRQRRSGRQVALIVVALIAALVLIDAIAPSMVAQQPGVSLSEHGAPDRAEARDPVTGATYSERENVKRMIEASTGGPFGRPLPPGETVDSLADSVIFHLQALGRLGDKGAAAAPDKAAVNRANQRALAAPAGHPDYSGVRSVDMPWHGRGE